MHAIQQLFSALLSSTSVVDRKIQKGSPTMLAQLRTEILARIVRMRYFQKRGKFSNHNCSKCTPTISLRCAFSSAFHSSLSLCCLNGSKLYLTKERWHVLTKDEIYTNTDMLKSRTIHFGFTHPHEWATAVYTAYLLASRHSDPRCDFTGRISFLVSALLANISYLSQARMSSGKRRMAIASFHIFWYTETVQRTLSK